MADLGFDSSVLSPFARASRLDTLEQLTRGHRRVTTPAVLDELDRGAGRYPLLATVRSVTWIEIVSANSLDELVAFSDFVRLLGAGTRNIGEASILAWARHAGGVALVDDQSAVDAAHANGVQVRRSLALLGEGVHTGLLAIEMACALVDELRAIGGARLPCDGKRFEEWAEMHGLFVRH